MFSAISRSESSPARIDKQRCHLATDRRVFDRGELLCTVFRREFDRGNEMAFDATPLFGCHLYGLTSLISKSLGQSLPVTKRRSVAGS